MCIGERTISNSNPLGFLGVTVCPPGKRTPKTKIKHTMKNLVINNGSFTAAGNFSGYTALGERVHIYKRQVEALGWSSNDDVAFPFYCIAADKEIQQINEKGEPTGEVSTRLTALSVFKTRDDISQAHVQSATLDIEIKKSIAEEASKVGLDKAAIDSLLSATV